MPDPFLRQIAQHSGLAESEAEEILGVFVKHLEDELARSGAAVIPGVGTFTRDNGTTEFEPDPDLSLAINFRNAGLDPIPTAVHGFSETTEEDLDFDDESDAGEEVAYAEAEPYEDETEDATEEVFSDMGSEEEFEESHVINAAHAEEEEIWDDEVEALPPPVAASVADEPELDDRSDWREDEDWEEHESDESETEIEEEAFVSSAPIEDVSTSDDAGPAEPIATTEPPPSPTEVIAEPTMAEEPAAPADRPPEESPRRKSATPWLLGIVGVLFLAIIGIMVLFMTSDSDPAPGDEAIVEAPPPPITDEDADEPGAFEENDFADPAVSEPEPEPAAPFDPLRGDNIDRSESRYTLVVASLPSDGAAEVVMNQWRNRGFRTAVFSETIDGVTRHRVGVGQFDTIDQADAVRARNDLQFPLPEGTWVYRYPAGTSN